MALTIKAINYKGQPLIEPLMAVFDEQGGTLGRAPGNHLVLADDEKVVSGEHASIKYENGCYYYIDTSLNGTQITNRNQRVYHEKILLKDQDELRVGDYDLMLSITSDASEAPSQQPNSFDNTMSISMFDPDSDQKCEPQTDDHRANDDVAIAFGDDPRQQYPEAIASINNEYHSPIDESFIPPELEAPLERSSDLPENLSVEDFFSNEGQAEETIADADFVSIQTPGEGRIQLGPKKPSHDQADPVGFHAPPDLSNQQTERRSLGHTPSETPDMVKEKIDAGYSKNAAILLNHFFQAAGIEEPHSFPKDKIPELMRTIGTVFRELTEGLMTVLRGRAELKSHLRVSMTTLKPTENNPLKFSPTVEEALKTFLMDNRPGFVDAIDAVREGYEDIQNHQLAITAGVQASLVSILKRFDPQSFSEKFEEGVVLQRKAKCWDEYKQAYQQIVEEALENFFGDDFVRAYEKQIDKLRTNRK